MKRVLIDCWAQLRRDTLKQSIDQLLKQEAQLSPRDRAMRRVN